MRDFIRKYGVWIVILVVLAGVLISTPSIRTGSKTKETNNEETAENPEFESVPALAKNSESQTEALPEQEDSDFEETGAVQEETVAVQEENVTLKSVGNYEELYHMLSRSRNETKQTVYAADGAGMEIGEVMIEDAAAAGASDTGTAGGAMQYSGVQEEDYSDTNTREENVNEGDIVKTDGRYIYVLDAAGNVHIVDGKSMEQIQTIAFAGKEQSKRMEMYVDGDILQVIWQEYDYISAQGEITLPSSSQSAREQDTVAVQSSKESLQQEKTRTYYSIPVTVTAVASYDITDREQPVKTGTYRQDGRYLSSRKNSENLYLFTSYTPYMSGGADRKESYVPRVGDAFLGCESIYYPGKSTDGCFGGTSYLVCGSVQNEYPDSPRDRMAVVSGGETFYVSEENIYAAVSQWEENSDYTEIVRMGYHDGYFIPGSSGRIPGTLNNSFSLDEYKDCLRVVVTCNSAIEKKDLFTTEVSFTRVNHLYVLNRYLEVIGKIEDLAEGEEIQSARFMGDTGYFVTYRNTDPLFSVDLSDPENPQVMGELKITGFSEYLHFYGENQLLGIGWETDPGSGANLGLKCAMFDLSDPADVKVTDQLIVEGVDYCAALDEYKSILVDTDKNMFGLAYMMYEEESWEEQYYYGVFTYSRESGFLPLQYIRIGDAMADGYEEYRCLRGLYIGNVFYLAGNHGVVSYDMAEDFEKMGEVYW